MNFEEFKKEFVKVAKNIEIELDEKQIENFYKYMNMLIEWNEKINLTAIIEPKEIILKHFIDSLTISKYISKNSKVIDVGTGAGFPGIPLKIIRDDTEIVLLDSLNKRINFLNEVIKELNLKNVETIHSRAEELGRNGKYREKFDVAVSRAVSNVGVLSEYLMPFVKVEGMAIYMKGSDVEKEVYEYKNSIVMTGGIVKNIEQFELPDTDIKRTLIIIKKMLKTSHLYPRRPGIPAKNPLR